MSQLSVIEGGVFMTGPPRVLGLTPSEQDVLDRLYKLWAAKLLRNKKRMDYYNGKNRLVDLGISIPPALKRVETVIGWPAKAVDVLAVRSVFEGFVYTDDAADPLLDVLLENDFGELYAKAVTAELTHSCAFVTVSKGAAGEPRVIISAYSAMTAAAIWDSRREQIAAGMAVTRLDDNGSPVGINLYLPGLTIEASHGSGNTWESTRHQMAQSRPLMEPLRYRPSLDRPLGKSRITRAVMSITDKAVSEALRTEIAAEFYTTPQRYLMGASSEVVEQLRAEQWSAYMGNIFSVSHDDSGEAPVYGQLPQMTMQPHLDYMRSLAAQFAGETGIPVSSLGVIHDNPSSAEAIHAVREDLIIEAEALNRSNSRSLKNIGLLAIAVDRGVDLSELSPSERALIPRFKNPARPSIASRADAMVKEAQVIAGLSESDIAMEELGYSPDQIARIKAERRSAGALDLMRMIIEGKGNSTQGEVHDDVAAGG